MNAEDGQDQAAVFRARLMAVIGVIAGSIGVVGFVAVVGGMVVWVRFESLHLAADTVVASIPRTTLIVIGLSTLIPFIGLGLLAVLLAYLFAADNLVPSQPWRDVRSAWSGEEAPAIPGMTPGSLTVAPTPSEQTGEARGAVESALAGYARRTAELATRAKFAADFGREKAVDKQHEYLEALKTELHDSYRWLREGAPTELNAAHSPSRARRSRPHAGTGNDSRGQTRGH
jgi:hypothetical protein